MTSGGRHRLELRRVRIDDPDVSERVKARALRGVGWRIVCLDCDFRGRAYREKTTALAVRNEMRRAFR